MLRNTNQWIIGHDIITNCFVNSSRKTVRNRVFSRLKHEFLVLFARIEALAKCFITTVQILS